MTGRNQATPLLGLLLQATLARLGHEIMTAEHDLELVVDLFKTAQHLAVAVGKPQDGVWNTYIVAKLAHQYLTLAQVVSGHPGEEVVNGLELKAAVKPVKPGRTFNVHCRTQLPLWKQFSLIQVVGRHTPVGEGNLNVKHHNNDIGDKNEGNADIPSRQGSKDESIAVQISKTGHKRHFSLSDPPGFTVAQGC